MSDEPFYSPTRKPEAPRQPTPGFKQWELHNGDRVLVCEFRDDEWPGAGVDVQLIEGGEILVSTRCVTADGARYVAESFRQEYLRTGWRESQSR
ncbi:MAG TPA: hypothetical protein VFA43_24740 [Gemmatimonadaceae bacterium]|nr:hypothetical protein [Gemmatimonadaceae bacterium]